MGVKNYNPKDVAVIVGGHICSGYASGAMVRIEHNEDLVRVYTGTKGEKSRAIQHDKGGKITVRLASTSLSNAALEAITLPDRVTGTVTFPVAVKDSSGATVWVGAHAWLMRRPDVEYGNEVGEIEWVFEIADLDGAHGGNPS